METYAENLLVVDDDEYNRDVLSRLLARSGYQVTTAEDGEEALGLVQHQPFDLLLLDNMMPGMTGVEVLRKLRTEYNASELPVIMVTAQSESENVVIALSSGANDYVTKPIDFAVVSARIRTQLSRKSAEAALRESEERYALAAQGTQDGLWDWDLRSNRLYFSPRWKEVLGYSADEVGDAPEEWSRRVHPRDRKRFLTELEAHRNGQAAKFQSEHRILAKDGTYRWCLSRGVAVRDATGAALRMAGSLTDITEAKVRDPLTGLPNRLYFLSAMERALERAGREPECQFAVIFLDLDRFKVVNDSLGHLAGDQLLAETAARIREGVRSGSDLIARFGGDEFAVLLDPVKSARDAEEVAERILAAIGRPCELGNRKVFPSGSAGIALNTPDCATPEDLLRNADTAMYHAKARGRACWVVFDAQMRQRVIERLQLETDLREGLPRGEIAVEYQPRVTLPGGSVVGFEALARWEHPTRGTMMPNEFITIAEEAGLMGLLGLTVLRQACRQAADWQRQFPMDPPLSISVNLSRQQLGDPRLVDQVRETLEETGLLPNTLALEITESIVAENVPGATEFLATLKALHVRLKMDDFGTAYSSLTRLRQFPFDTLKIDRSFIRRMDQDEESREIVHSMIDLAHNLGMAVVAEGVESEAQSRYLRVFGCEYGEGHLFSRPVSPKSAGQMIAAGAQALVA